MSRFFGPKLAIARAAGGLSRASGRGGGTTLPGRILLRMAPDAIALLGSRLPDGATIVSATTAATVTAIAATTAASPTHPTAVGRSRTTSAAQRMTAGRMTGRGTIGAWTAHSRSRNAPTGMATA